MDKLFSRTFTTREKVLFVILAVLLIGCFYYLAVFKPSIEAKDRAEAQIAHVQDEITEQKIIATQCTQMKKEIEQAQARGIQPKELPKSDNSKNILDELNSVLSGTSTFNISFEGASTSNGIVRRTVKVAYTCSSFSQAEATLRALMDCRYSCMVTDFAISQGGSSGSPAPASQAAQAGNVSTTAIVTFFESA